MPESAIVGNLVRTCRGLLRVLMGWCILMAPVPTLYHEARCHLASTCCVLSLFDVYSLLPGVPHTRWLPWLEWLPNDGCKIAAPDSSNYTDVNVELIPLSWRVRRYFWHVETKLQTRKWVLLIIEQPAPPPQPPPFFISICSSFLVVAGS